MNKKVKRYITITLGWLFIVLGIAGLFLPLLQGILFIFIGFGLLSREYHWAGKLLERISRRYPKLGNKMALVKEKEKKLLNKILGKS